jgi:hypothetical protein
MDQTSGFRSSLEKKHQSSEHLAAARRQILESLSGWEWQMA